MLTYDWRVATRDVDAVFEADRTTIRRLANEIGWTGVGDALDLVAAYYPAGLIEPKTRFGLEEIFGKLALSEKPPGSGPAEP